MLDDRPGGRFARRGTPPPPKPGSPSPWRWRRRLAALALSAIAAGAALSACGGNSGALGHQACAEVERSIALYHRSLNASGTTAASERARALSDLQRAMRPAALASSKGGNWQALEATLEESNRVPESDLVSALSAQCAGVTSASG